MTIQTESHKAPENLKTDFDEIFKGTIVPFLKDLGFKRKTLHFARQVNDITQSFNVQKSLWNSYFNSLSFTFNLGFFNSTIHNIAWEKEDVIEFPKTTDCFIQTRLGMFSHKRDHWYELSSRVDKNKVALQVKSDLESYLVPLLEKYQSLEELNDFIEMRQNKMLLSPFNYIVFLMLTNQREKGVETLNDNFKKALVPQTSTHTTNYPGGRSEVQTSKPYVNQHFIYHLVRLAKYYEVKLLN